MNLRILYKKQIQLLRLSKKYAEEADFGKLSFVARDAYLDLFYKSNDMLKEEFVELFPPSELSRVRRLIDFSRSVSISSPEGYSSTYRGIRFKRNELINEYEWLINKMEELIQAKYQLSVFYSWQSDLPNYSNRSFIEDCIINSIKSINNDYSLFLKLDQDTRNVPGTPDIIDTILRKIENSFIYVADVSIIGKIYKKNKYTANQNVMFELGYALSVLQESNIILICNTDLANTKELPFDIGKKRLITYCLGEKNKNDKSCIKKEVVGKIYEAIKCIVDNN